MKKQNRRSVAVRTPWIPGESVKDWLERVLCIQSKKDVNDFIVDLAHPTSNCEAVSRNTIKKYMDTINYGIDREYILRALETHQYTSKEDGATSLLGRYGYELISGIKNDDKLKKITEIRTIDYWNIIEHQCQKVGTQCDVCDGSNLYLIKPNEKYRIINGMLPIELLSKIEPIDLVKLQLTGGNKRLGPPRLDGPPYFGATIYLSTHVDKQFGSINACKSNDFPVEMTLCEFCLKNLSGLFNMTVADALCRIKNLRNWTMSELGSALCVTESTASRLARRPSDRRIGEEPPIKRVQPETLLKLISLYREAESDEFWEYFNHPFDGDNGESEYHEHLEQLKDKNNSFQYLREHFLAKDYDISINARGITTFTERQRDCTTQKTGNKKQIDFSCDLMIESLCNHKIAAFLNVEASDLFIIMAIANQLNATHIWYIPREIMDIHQEPHVCMDLNKFPPVFCETPINHTFLTYRTNEDIESKKYRILDNAMIETMQDVAYLKAQTIKSYEFWHKYELQYFIEKMRGLKIDETPDLPYCPYTPDVDPPFIEDLTEKTLDALGMMTKLSDVESFSKIKLLINISRGQPKQTTPKNISQYLLQFPPRDLLQWNFQAEIYKTLINVLPNEEHLKLSNLFKDYAVDLEIILNIAVRHGELIELISD